MEPGEQIGGDRARRLLLPLVSGSRQLPQVDGAAPVLHQALPQRRSGRLPVARWQAGRGLGSLEESAKVRDCAAVGAGAGQTVRAVYLAGVVRLGRRLEGPAILPAVVRQLHTPCAIDWAAPAGADLQQHMPPPLPPLPQMEAMWWQVCSVYFERTSAVLPTSSHMVCG